MKKVYSSASIAAVSYRKKAKTINGQPKDYYMYPTTMGDFVYRIKVGEDGITQADIEMLYNMDNAEVDRNCRKDKPEWTEVEEEQLRKYEETHYGNVGKNWTDSLERIAEETFGLETDMDELRFMFDDWKERNPDESDAARRLKEVLLDLDQEDQLLINLVFYKQCTYAEAGKVLGITSTPVRNRLKKIFKKIREVF